VRVTIYYNPRCTKSRQALQLLRDRGVDPEVINYLHDPPSAQELGRILGLLGMAPRDLIRRKEKEYRAAGLDDPAVSDEALVSAMVSNPILMERPIVVTEKAAALGRPPENVLTVLD